MGASDKKFDVVIVGAGLAGIVAAIECLEANKTVCLLDRDVPEKLGGLARWSFGGMFFVNTPHQKKRGIQDNVDLALSDWFSYAEFDQDAHWPRKWAEQYVHLCTDHVYHWMIKQGVSYFPVVHWTERGLHVRGNSVPRFHMAWGTGEGLTDTLIGKLKGHNNVEKLRLEFRHRVTDFSSQNGQITGVVGINEDSGLEFEFPAENVIVAAGGITGSMEMVRKHWYKPWGEPPKEILNGSHPVADGAVHELVQKHQGNLTHLEKAWHYAAGVEHPNPKFENHGLSLVPVKSALWLNYQGQRMGPVPLVSAFDTRFLVERICQEPVKHSWQLLNMNIAVKELAVSGSEYNDAVKNKQLFKFIQTVLLGNKSLVNTLLKECPDFVTGNSLEELAEKMNALTEKDYVDVKLMKASVKQYDDMIARGPKYFNDPQLRMLAQLRQYTGDKLRTSAFVKIVDSSSMPLIAIRERILSRKSLGGIQTDLDGRVLSQPGPDGKQEPIRGLWAVGEAAGFGGGGIHGLRSLEGTFLGTCVLTGRITAQAIAGKKLN